MKKFAVIIVLSSLTLLSNLYAATRTALVIGNSSYQTAPLTNPVNDATDISNVLKEFEFDVDLVLNGSKRIMTESIRSFGKKLTKGGIGLFYYAGHGMQVKGRNYLIPTNAIIESESDVEFEALDVGRILGKMEDAGNGLK